MTPEATIFVHYAEGQGDAQRVALQIFWQQLPAHPGFLSADLLRAEDQPRLTLVASRWQSRVPALLIPEGVRAWTFIVQDSVSPA